jgi:hypothetical protein
MERKKTKRPEKQIDSVGDVSAMIGKHPRTIYRAIKTGRIKTIRLGASIGIPHAEVERILAKGF